MKDPMNDDRTNSPLARQTFRTLSGFSRFWIVLPLFFLSGASGLIYEVVWTRMLTLVFGGTVFAISAVLTSFMMGLGVGGFLFGVLADKSKNPLKLYALLELALAAYAAATPYLFTALDYLHVEIISSAQANSCSIVLIRLSLSLTALITPTILMGATLPAISKFFVSEFRRVGAGVGALYAINTFGAVAGCIVSGFVLIGSVGVSASLYVAAGVSLFVGVAALALAATTRRGAPLSEDVDGRSLDQTSPIDDGRLAYSSRIVVFMLFASAVSGFTSLAYQVLWARDFSLIFENTVYGFTIVVTTFLSGLALGSFVFARLADKVRCALTLFAVVQVLIGLSAMLLIDNSTRVRLTALLSSHRGMRLGYETWSQLLKAKLAVAFLTMFLPTFLMGGAFPLVVKVCIRSWKRLGQGVGRVYAANTLGCVLGCFAAGFLLIPLLGAQRSIALVAMMNVSIGIASALVDRFPTFKIKPLLAVMAISMALVGLRYSLERNKHSGVEGEGILYSKESTDALVEVIQLMDPPSKGLRINNHRMLGGTAPAAMRLQRRQGHLPILLHPNPKDVLVIGFATGTTAGAIKLHEEVERIDCVEIISCLKETAQFFSSANHDIAKDLRFNFIAEDGRNYVRTTQREYDVIISDLFQAHAAGVGNLYTKEHFQNCAQRLKEGGLMCQWMPSDQLTPADFKTLIATFQHCFPDTTLWLADIPDLKGICGLIGVKGSLIVDLEALSNRLQGEAAERELEEIFLDDPYAILSSFIMGNNSLTRYAAGAPLNTDDHPRIEFSAPKAFAHHAKLGAMNLWNVTRFRESILPRLVNVGDSPQKIKLVNGRLDQRFRAKTHTIQAQFFAGQGRVQEAAMEYQRALEACPGNREVEYLSSLNTLE